MPLDTTTRMLAPFLDRLTDEELDAIPYGVIQLDAEGFILACNRAETESLGVSPRPLGRHYFLDVCPSAQVHAVWGRFRQAVLERRVDETFPFTFTCATEPRRVQMRMYYSVRTRAVWLFTARPDGSPLDRVVLCEDAA